MRLRLYTTNSSSTVEKVWLTWWGYLKDGKRLMQNKTIPNKQHITYMTIIKQQETIKSLQQIPTDWTSLKPLLRYAVSSASGKGISLLQIFGAGWLGWAISSRDALAPTSSGPTWRPLGSRLPSLHAPSRVMQQIAASGEASSADARRRIHCRSY
jgi:hypothetical protein